MPTATLPIEQALINLHSTITDFIESPLVKLTSHLKDVKSLRYKLLKYTFLAYKMTNKSYCSFENYIEAIVFITDTQNFLDEAIGLLAWHYTQECLINIKKQK